MKLSALKFVYKIGSSIAVSFFWVHFTNHTIQIQRHTCAYRLLVIAAMELRVWWVTHFVWRKDNQVAVFCLIDRCLPQNCLNINVIWSLLSSVFNFNVQETEGTVKQNGGVNSWNVICRCMHWFYRKVRRETSLWRKSVHWWKLWCKNTCLQIQHVTSLANSLYKTVYHPISLIVCNHDNIEHFLYSQLVK